MVRSNDSKILVFVFSFRNRYISSHLEFHYYLYWDFVSGSLVVYCVYYHRLFALVIQTQICILLKTCNMHHTWYFGLMKKISLTNLHNVWKGKQASRFSTTSRFIMQPLINGWWHIKLTKICIHVLSYRILIRLGTKTSQLT